MSTTRRRFARTAALMGATLGLALGAAIPAQAVTTDQYDRVKTVFCSSERYGNEVEYYAGDVKKDHTVQLRENNKGLWCGSSSFTEGDEYGDFIAASITNPKANYVYCAIWINGRIDVASEDRASEYSAPYTYCI
ncbi:hypothetical protein HOT75_gp122 [Gordonia phage Daredevil]|uniref:Uncharacterized protein n=1 Tax=Gordonia phage Daredevil TaxID=2283286 RepID=A0A345MIX8_9CAUD|nr:hypothetical protein HOT75_gp122 [Gordonia phage Daredevil]AXH70509.1 hypothetical protein SEA_DAREDEVIL_122 [Gordonia phage Daredevil]